MSADRNAQPAPADDVSQTAARRALGAVKVDASHLSSSYCNVVSANGTREEVALTFGVNQDWERTGGEMGVRLLHRVIMSPHGAKRLHERLSRIIQEYESRHGELGV